MFYKAKFLFIYIQFLDNKVHCKRCMLLLLKNLHGRMTKNYSLSKCINLNAKNKLICIYTSMKATNFYITIIIQSHLRV